MIKVGDIRIVKYNDLLDARHVLVLKVWEETVLVSLCHPYMEFATEYDQKVYPKDTGLKYGLCVQTDLVGAVYVDALCDNAIGFLDMSTHTTNVGPPLLGPLDARWDFKASEGEVMQAIGAVVFFDTLERNPA